MSYRSVRATITAACLLAFAVVSLARAENRSLDGSGNNLAHNAWGGAGTHLVRISAPHYADGISTPAGSTRPNPRSISNVIVAATEMRPNTNLLSDWTFQWGQVIDHDLTLSDLANPMEDFSFAIPAGDPIFDPMNTGTEVMRFFRSRYDTATGTSVGNPRQQINELTAYVDASMVYGSSDARGMALRSLSGGRMLTSPGNLLPYNTMGLPNATGGAPDPTQFFAAGDVRVNEQIGLTAVHTLLLREHNRRADVLAAQNPGWNDEQLYQRARKFVGAIVQSITYNEYLPALLGSHAPGLDSVYNDQVDAGVATEFSAALYRVGHTMLSNQLLRIQNDGTEAPGGPVALRNAFFLPQNISNGQELEYLLKGLATQQQQQIDSQVVDGVRNFLFGDPIPGGFDLPALNVQRGRDHGLPDYNSLREAYGLTRVTSFDEISSDPAVVTALGSLYSSVDDVDPWIGALAEDHLPGAAVGELVAAGLIDQFTRARDGDRFWYRNDPEFDAADVAMIDQTTLSDLILWNTDITNLSGDVFHVPEPISIAMWLIPIAFAGRHRVRCKIRRHPT